MHSLCSLECLILNSAAAWRQLEKLRRARAPAGSHFQFVQLVRRPRGRPASRAPPRCGFAGSQLAGSLIGIFAPSCWIGYLLLFSLQTAQLAKLWRQKGRPRARARARETAKQTISKRASWPACKLASEQTSKRASERTSERTGTRAQLVCVRVCSAALQREIEFCSDRKLDGAARLAEQQTNLSPLIGA